jgi:hypothetical protein
MIEPALETPYLLQKKMCRTCKVEKIRLDFANQTQHQCRACVYEKRNKKKLKVVESPFSWKRGYYLPIPRNVDLL